MFFYALHIIYTLHYCQLLQPDSYRPITVILKKTGCRRIMIKGLRRCDLPAAKITNLSCENCADSYVVNLCLYFHTDVSIFASSSTILNVSSFESVHIHIFSVLNSEFHDYFVLMLYLMCFFIVLYSYLFFYPIAQVSALKKEFCFLVFK